VGAFWSLNLQHEAQGASFQRVVERLAGSSIETFLKVGCCLGHVIRYLAYSGVVSERLNGTDLQHGLL
jgi:hypothetical protein